MFKLWRGNTKLNLLWFCLTKPCSHQYFLFIQINPIILLIIHTPFLIARWHKKVLQDFDFRWIECDQMRLKSIGNLSSDWFFKFLVFNLKFPHGFETSSQLSGAHLKEQTSYLFVNSKSNAHCHCWKSVKNKKWSSTDEKSLNLLPMQPP